MIATLAVFAVAMVAMALGVMLGGRRLSGSCGGVPGKECSCSLTQRKECELRAADADYGKDDDHHHLSVVDERER